MIDFWLPMNDLKSYGYWDIFQFALISYWLLFIGGVNSLELSEIILLIKIFFSQSGLGH